MKTSFAYYNTIGDIYFGKHKSNCPLIIISHGFKGWKDWGFIPYIAQKFSENGAIVITFNYSKNGNPDNTGFLMDLGIFAENSISDEVEELSGLINAIQNDLIDEFSLVKKNWNRQIYLAGHSLGAGVSLIAGIDIEKISKILMWASIGKFDRYTKRQKDLWRKVGYIEFPNQKTNQILRMNVKYLEDFEANKYRFDLINIIKNLTKPVMLIHGEQDVTVPQKEIEPLIMNANKEYFYHKIIQKTGHTFGVEHPFDETNPYLEELLAHSLHFFQLEK